MAFRYHPPTRQYCPICEELSKTDSVPIIEQTKLKNGKASSANSFPFHNWYSFVLGYSPEFPDYILNRENLGSGHFVVDPFMGSGTTLVCCKDKNIASAGIDANDFFVDAAKVKLNWNINITQVEHFRDLIISVVEDRLNEINFINYESKEYHPGLFEKDYLMSAQNYAEENRPNMLNKRYISDKPFAKAHIIKNVIGENVTKGDIKKLFNLALCSILLQISNVRYGPGFGVIKPREDVDVLDIFIGKINRMISDLRNVSDGKRSISSEVILGDSRMIGELFSTNSVDLMITSPPYPGDHEYTKHTRLELIFMDYAHNISEFRKIKKRMLRGSTTNIYKEDKEIEYVKHLKSIQQVTGLIDERLKDDGATSGFEKLYTKLIWEYFGGMFKVLSGVHDVLKESGKISLLVSDSHAFKMVHIQSASILAEIASYIGFKESIMELWQNKISTSHKYNMRENILTLVK